MTLLASARLLLAGMALAVALPAAAQDADRRAALDARIARLEAIKAIERLQYAYGYYQDRFFYSDVASLFAGKQPTVQWGDQRWIGPRAVRSFWLDYWRPVFAAGSAGPVAGRLFDLPQWQGIITVAPDGQSARARFRTIGRLAIYRDREFWISGFYENRYVREGGVWKIADLKFCPNWSARYTAGWQNVTKDDALAWLPPTPLRAKPSQVAVGAQACPAPYPEPRTQQFDFDEGEAR